MRAHAQALSRSFSKSFPEQLYISHSNMVRWLHVAPRNRKISDLLSGNIAILRKVRALLLRVKGKIEIGRALAVSATQMGLQKRSSWMEVTSYWQAFLVSVSHKCFCGGRESQCSVRWTVSTGTYLHTLGNFFTSRISFRVDLPNSKCYPKTGSSVIIILLYLLVSIF